MDNTNFPESQSNDNLSTIPQTEEVSKTGQKLKGRYINFFARAAKSIKNVDVKEKIHHSTSRMRNGNYKRYSKYLIPAIGAVAIIIFSLLAGKIFLGNNSADKQVKAQSQVADAIAKEDVNKVYEFPFKDDKDKVLGKLKYTIESADIRNQIYIKGSPATALKGKEFLVLYLKLKNDTNNGVRVNTRDYVRLSVNNKDEWLAPSIHNDPVEVQAQSTEKTRAGFIINSSDKVLVLKIGEIQGKKDTISLKLK